ACALPISRVGAQRLDADVEGAQDRRIAHRAVDHDARPAVVHAAPGDDVADQGGVHAGAAVDDEHPALARLAQGLLDQQVVLEAADGDDAAGEHGSAAELDELGVAAADVGTDLVGQIRGGDLGG